MCARQPPQKKTVRCRKLKGLDSEVLRKAVAEISLCSNPADSLEVLVTQYQEDLTEVLESVAPVQTRCFVERPLIPWINNDILECKRQKRKMEKLWRKKQLTVYHDMYVASKQKLQNMMNAAKIGRYKGKSQDQSRIFGMFYRTPKENLLSLNTRIHWNLMLISITISSLRSQT